jgi:hypothetical protein
MICLGKDLNHSNQCLRDLDTSLFNNAKFVIQNRSRLVTFEHATELVMVLPGKVAKETRTQFANIINRYIAGDHSLIKEIQANAESASPVAQMARKSLGIATEEDLKRKRQREEIDMVAAKQRSIITFIDTMERLDPDWKKDTRLLVQTKDYLKNITLGQQAIEGSGKGNEPIYISEVARALGYSKLTHGECSGIGKKASELYRAKHGADPPKRKQFVDGAERLVAAYTSADREIIDKAIKDVLGK